MKLGTCLLWKTQEILKRPLFYCFIALLNLVLQTANQNKAEITTGDMVNIDNHKHAISTAGERDNKKIKFILISNHEIPI